MISAFPILFASILVAVPAAYSVLLSSGYSWKDESQTFSSAQELCEQWDLGKLPNPNDTDHLVFETAHSLLQHWPNTRMRNGHNIVPGVIPQGTLLYRGWPRKLLPHELEWVSFDPEHSHLFCVDEFRPPFSEQGCWHLTLAATRPLKVVYFDGGSAVKMPDGTLDTQDLVAWGKFGTGYQFEEHQRIQDLCKWGKRFGIDGFVRMEMDFEVMICSFTSGLSVVSFVNLESRGAISPMTPAFVDFEVMNAGSWHGRFPGETRVHLDFSGLISLYDTQLAPSLVAVRVSQERWDHRVRNISNEDMSAVKSRLEAALVRPSGMSSGIDWKTLIQVMVDRFAGRLELTRQLLNSSVTRSESDELLDLANKTQTQLRVMLTPYILLSAAPSELSDETDLDWTKPIYRLCATTHTHFVESLSDSMTDSERLLLQAVRGTTREICRVVTKMWATGVYVGIDASLNTKESPDVARLNQVWNVWAEDLDRLMTWLDWSVWVKCRPDCGLEEMCYLPTWPLGFPRMGSAPGRKPPSLAGPFSKAEQHIIGSLPDEVIIMPKSDEWIRPQPKCIRRLAPHAF